MKKNQTVNSTLLGLYNEFILTKIKITITIKIRNPDCIKSMGHPYIESVSALSHKKGLLFFLQGAVQGRSVSTGYTQREGET